MSHELIPTQNVEEIKPYTIVTAHSVQLDLSNNSSSAYKTHSSSMLVKCRACEREFDSTFTVDDFAKLPLDQKESGTLHLCPHCGTLGLYVIHDYFEQK